jgi:hypothetical protein
LTGFCTSIVGTTTTGALLGLGSEDVTKPACNNGASNVLGVPMPSAGTLKNLTVVSSFTAAPLGPSGGPYSITATVWVGGAQTNNPVVACTFLAGTACSDLVDTSAIGPGVSVAVVLTFGSGGPNVGDQLSVHASLEKQ